MPGTGNNDATSAFEAFERRQAEEHAKEEEVLTEQQQKEAKAKTAAAKKRQAEADVCLVGRQKGETPEMKAQLQLFRSLFPSVSTPHPSPSPPRLVFSNSRRSGNAARTSGGKRCASASCSASRSE
jgi:hypothetical protein